MASWLEKLGDVVESVNPFTPPKKVQAQTGAITAAQEAAGKTQAGFEQALAGMPTRTVAPTEVQQVNRAGVQNVAPTQMQPTQVNRTGIAPVTAGPQVAGVAGQVGSVLNPTVAAETAAVEQAKTMALQAAQGQAPSFAEAMLKQNQETMLKQQQAALASRAYDPAAQRQLAVQTAEAGQALGQQAAGLRAQEMAQGRSDFASIAQNSRAQMLGASTTDVQARLSALSGDQQAFVAQRAQDLQAQGINQDTAVKLALADQQAAVTVTIQNAENNLRAQLANQGVDLEVLKANAAMGNQAALADLDAKLKIMGLDDQMRQTYLNGIVALQSQQGGAAGTAAQLGTQAQIANQDAAQKQKAALLSGMSSAGAAALSQK
jgi:hypothetical protein